MSIVNNNILSYFWTKIQTYINARINDNIPYSCQIYRGSGSTQTSFGSANTQYIVKFNTATNTDIATINDGTCTIQQSGMYYICCKVNTNTSGTGKSQVWTLRVNKNPTSTAANSGIVIGMCGRYNWTTNSLRCCIQMPLCEYFEAGDTFRLTLAVATADTNASIQQGISYSNAEIIKVG